MDKFVKFITNYIENTEIHGKKGWINQLTGYQWKTENGIENFSQGLQISKDFNLKTQNVLKSLGNLRFGIKIAMK